MAKAKKAAPKKRATVKKAAPKRTKINKGTKKLMAIVTEAKKIYKKTDNRLSWQKAVKAAAKKLK